MRSPRVLRSVTLLCPLSSLEGATTRSLDKLPRDIDALIVQREERALRRRSTSSYSRVHACPCFRLGQSRSENGRRSRDRPHSMIGNSPCRGFAPAVARVYLHRTMPRRGLPESMVCTCHWLPSDVPPYFAASGAGVIARPTAQMKPASSRATAVMATVLSLPLRISAR